MWRPREPLFWLALVFNALSSVMTTVLWVWQPVGGLRLALALLALANTLLGAWALLQLWRKGAPAAGRCPR